MGVSIVAWGISRSFFRSFGSAHRWWRAYERHGRHRSACAASTPRRASPARTPKSVGRNTSGSPSPRISTYPVVHGPTPGTAPSAAESSSRSAPPSSTIRPSPTRVASSVIVRRRLAGIGSRAGSIAASAAGAGKTCVSSGTAETRSGSPAAATMRPATVRAPATEICCPTTARTAISKGSTAPGERRPGAAATTGASTGSAARTASTATGSASRSRRRRRRLDGEVEVAPVLEPEPSLEDRPGPARRRPHLGHPVTVGKGERAVIRRAVPVLDPGIAREARKASSTEASNGSRAARSSSTVPFSPRS